MSLERKEARAKLDDDVHEQLLAICTVRGITVAEFVENLIVPEVRRLVHEAHDIASRTAAPGITGKNREPAGVHGKGHR